MSEIQESSKNESGPSKSTKTNSQSTTILSLFSKRSTSNMAVPNPLTLSEPSNLSINNEISKAVSESNMNSNINAKTSSSHSDDESRQSSGNESSGSSENPSQNLRLPNSSKKSNKSKTNKSVQTAEVQKLSHHSDEESVQSVSSKSSVSSKKSSTGAIVNNSRNNNRTNSSSNDQAPPKTHNTRSRTYVNNVRPSPERPPVKIGAVSSSEVLSNRPGGISGNALNYSPPRRHFSESSEEQRLAANPYSPLSNLAADAEHDLDSLGDEQDNDLNITQEITFPTPTKSPKVHHVPQAGDPDPYEVLPPNPAEGTFPYSATVLKIPSPEEAANAELAAKIEAKSTSVGGSKDAYSSTAKLTSSKEHLRSERKISSSNQNGNKINSNNNNNIDNNTHSGNTLSTPSLHAAMVSSVNVDDPVQMALVFLDSLKRKGSLPESAQHQINDLSTNCKRKPKSGTPSPEQIINPRKKGTSDSTKSRNATSSLNRQAADPVMSSNAKTSAPSSSQLTVKAVRTTKTTTAENYTLSSTPILRPASVASTFTNQILISRLRPQVSFSTILQDLASISNFMGVSFKLDEFRSRYNSGNWVFQTQDDRVSTIIYLDKFKHFNSSGNLRTEDLPIFFFTQKGTSSSKTSLRLTVQAIPPGSPLTISSLHSVASYRGFPDSCFVASAYLPMIVDNVVTKSNSTNFLAIYSSLRVYRFVSDERLMVDELYLNLYSTSKPMVESLRNVLSSLPQPSHSSIGCWSGQIANSMDGFINSPTNVPSLCISQFVLTLGDVTGNLREDLHKLIKYFPSFDTPENQPAAVTYRRTSIDPFFTADLLYIFPPSPNGIVPLDNTKWLIDHPHLPCNNSRPGFTTLKKIYQVDPSSRTDPFFTSQTDNSSSSTRPQSLRSMLPTSIQTQSRVSLQDNRTSGPSSTPITQQNSYTSTSQQRPPSRTVSIYAPQSQSTALIPSSATADLVRHVRLDTVSNLNEDRLAKIELSIADNKVAIEQDRATTLSNFDKQMEMIMKLNSSLLVLKETIDARLPLPPPPPDTSTNTSL